MNERRASSPASATQWRRVLCAGAIVCGLVALPCIVDTALGKAQVGMHVVEAASGESDADVPAWFSEELFSLQGYSDVRMSARAEVVGFTMQEQPVGAFARLAELMEQKGWVFLKSGVAGSGSFLKDSGSCRWAWISCFDMSDTTSVVVQCMRAS